MNINDFFNIYNNKQQLNQEEKNELSVLQKELFSSYKKKNEEFLKDAITVRDLFWKTNFEDVYKFIKDNKWAEDANTDKTVYQNIFKFVRSQPQIKIKPTFMVCSFEGDISSPPNVFSLEIDDITHFGFDFESYSELANYFIHPNSIENSLNLTALAAGILEEFSWNPVEEEKETRKEELFAIQEKALEFHENIKKEESVSSEIESLDDSENVVNFFSFDKNEHDDDDEDIDDDDIDDDDDDIDDDDNYPYSKENGFLLKEILSFYSFKELENSFIDFCKNNYSHSLKVKENELSHLFSEIYFKIKSELINTSNSIFGKTLISNANSDFFYFKKEESSEMVCIITGEELFNYINCRFEHRFSLYEGHNIFAFFVFSVLSSRIAFEKHRCSDDIHYEFLMIKLKNKKEFSRIADKINRYSLSFDDLSYSELESLIIFTYKFLPKY